MLFLITQTHEPESCPKDEGGSKTLYNADAEGIEIKAIYGAYAEHIVYYLVEADSMSAVNKLLFPGFKRCSCKITAVSDEPIVK